MVTPAENFLNRKSVGFTSRRGLRDLFALAVQNTAASDSGVYPVRAGVVQNQLSQSSTYDQLNRLTGNTRRGAANQSWTLDTDNVLSRQEPKSRLSAGAAHREINQDPAGYINGANAYQFVMSNPAGNVDPWGLHWWDSNWWWLIPPIKIGGMVADYFINGEKARAAAKSLPQVKLDWMDRAYYGRANECPGSAEPAAEVKALIDAKKAAVSGGLLPGTPTGGPLLVPGTTAETNIAKAVTIGINKGIGAATGGGAPTAK